MMSRSYIYTSPLRPPGLDWIIRRTGLQVDWDNTDVGPWYPRQRFAFNGLVPEDMARQLDLEAVTGPGEKE